MRRIALASIVLVLAAGALACAWLAPPAWKEPPPPVREGAVVPHDRLHRGALANGMHVLILEDHRLPRVELGVAVRRGAGIEPLEQAGLATYAAELMKRGAGGRDALALAQTVERLGASLSVSAGWDSASAGVAGLAEDSDTLLAILADVVLRPRFEPEEASRARSERVASLRRARDDPSTLAQWHFARALYPGHRYGLPIDGTPETVARLDEAAARAWHQRVFTPANAIFYAVGDVDPAALRTAVAAAFGGWSPGPVPPSVAPPPAQAPPERRVIVVDRPDLNQATLRMGHEGIARTDPRRIAANVMNDVLGGAGFLSRLMIRVRAEEGLAYGIGSGFGLRRRPGPFVVATSTRVAKTPEVVEIVLAELDRMRSAPPTPDELRNAKSFAAGHFALGLETSSAILGALVDLDVYGLPEDALDTYRTRLRAVTGDHVHEIARTLLHPERTAIVAVGPAEALREPLARFGPVEVTAP